MLVRLGEDGVTAGREGLLGRRRVASAGCCLRERGRRPSAAAAAPATRCASTARTWLAPTARVPGLANIDPAQLRGAVEGAAQAGDWERVREIQDHLARLMFVTRVVKATVGFGAGVGAFKTALWQMGVFNTNQMREPVSARSRAKTLLPFVRFSSRTA